jgi:hypothetical protein
VVPGEATGHDRRLGFDLLYGGVSHA